MKSTYEIDPELDLVLERTVDVPPSLVWKVWTTPEHLMPWFCPKPWRTTECEMDLRPGGEFRWRWRSNEDGKEFGFHGEFREVVVPSKIVHTEIYDPGDLGGSMGDEAAIVTVTFVERDGRTTVKTSMDFGSKGSRDAAMGTGMTEGMEQSYRLLDAVLAERRA